MRSFIPLLCLCLCTSLSAQSSLMDSLIWQNYQYRHQQNMEFSDSSESPLEEKDRLEFESLDWYPIDTNFIVWARLERSPEAEVFEMPTSTDRKPQYRQYGILHFALGDSTFAVPIYRNMRLKQIPPYQKHLFFPFSDLTNSFGTYGGGRYLDLQIPKGDSVLIDFNRAYNPYCAYNGKYSCPIPPRKNQINFQIKAGVRYRVKH